MVAERWITAAHRRLVTPARSSPLPAHPWGSLTNNAGAYPAGGTASPRDLDALRARLERAWAAEAEE